MTLRAEHEQVRVLDASISDSMGSSAPIAGIGTSWP